MKHTLLSLCAVCSLALAHPGATAQVAHIQHTLDDASIPVSADVMNDRIAAAALNYQKYGTIARFAQYDFALPRDAEESLALQGYGVMLVSVISQQADELPPRRVFAKIGETVVPLTLYAARAGFAAPGPLVRQVFGVSRWEGLYLVPLNVYAADAKVLIDFARNRDGFAVAQFGDRERRAMQALKVAAPTPEAPPEGALRQFLAREYPGFALPPSR